MDSKQIKRPKESTKKSQTRIVRRNRPDFAFIRRNITFHQGSDLVLKKINMKRLYVRKILEIDDNHPPKLAAEKPFIKNKLFKGLVHAQLSSCAQLYWGEALKNARNLKTLKIESECNLIEINNFVKYIRILPKATERVKLEVSNAEEQPTMSKDIIKIPRMLRRLRGLTSYHRSLWYNENGEFVTKELNALNKYMKRLKNPNNVDYTQTFAEQRTFQLAMRKDVKYPAIRSLALELTSEKFPDYINFYGEFFQEEISEDYDRLENDFQNELDDSLPSVQETDNIFKVVRDTYSSGEESKTSESITESRNQNNEIHSEIREASSIFIDGESSSENKDSRSESYENEMEIQETSHNSDSETIDSQQFHMIGDLIFRRIAQYTMNYEMSLFFKFKNFPNLQKLSINIHDPLYPLGQFVVDGFASLKKLEHLSIEIMHRSPKTKYLFEGLLVLPKLKHFGLRIPFLNERDWNQLKRFTEKQKDLNSLKIVISSERSGTGAYLRQNQNITELIQTLKDHRKLEYLNIASSFWSLEALSEGLKALTMINQFKSVKLEGFDDVLTSNKTCSKRIEGLVSFLKRQKGTLHTLFIRMPHILQQTLIHNIGEAISELKELRELVFSMNLAFLYGLDFYTMYFEDTLVPLTPWEVEDKLKIPKAWNINLAKNIKKLEKLEKLSLHFDVVTQVNETSLKWFLDILRVIPVLKSLKKVDFFTTSTEAIRLVSETICQRILELENTTQLDALIFNETLPFRRDMQTIQEAIEKLNHKQSLKCELMF